jgi:hypothetical protein
MTLLVKGQKSGPGSPTGSWWQNLGQPPSLPRDPALSTMTSWQDASVVTSAV